MIGDLFYRKVPPAEIMAMGWAELKYWDGWHKVLNEEEKRAIKAGQGK